MKNSSDDKIEQLFSKSIKRLLAKKMIVIKTQNTIKQDLLSQAISILDQGGLIIYPTETVYGLGVDATNPEAIKKLLAFKSRREGKPLSIAVADQHTAEQFVDLNDQARQFYQRFLPGPYTIISKYKQGLATGVVSEFNTLGIRIPDYQLVLELLKKFGKPITATSANASGKKRPYSILDILNNISDKQKKLIDLIIDEGTLPTNEPSIVIDTTLSTPLTIRDNFSQDKRLQLSTTLKSHSNIETQEIAGKLLLKYWDKLKNRGLLIALDGELGAGKTVFAKGIAKFLGISQPITSPTYTYCKEYDYSRHDNLGKFYHLDLWRVEDQELANSLQIETLLTAKNLVAVEWFSEKQHLFNKLKPDLIIQIQVVTNNKRRLAIIEKTNKCGQ